MAEINIFPIVVVLFLVGSTFPTLEATDYKVLAECKKHFSIKYAWDAYNYIFHGRPISDKSCRAIVAVGKKCHDTFLSWTLEGSSEIRRSKALAMGKQLWNHCVLTTIAPASSSY
ncbi:hypothetical protein D8674_028493 [Pyrus ussuriensis x Pyrus communis]|uniref:Prolamin-like domain-containing protein n=1 Tax=Pyrus ussuriensis x Pyrus communis TaxID=2448454 RepID=A0A5N5HWE2_9ROSA|nr:hypothetical protein D8674_028493 [Pyrus ussuriensis x Pyrus communis]